MIEHEQRDAVRASMLMVPGHEVYRVRPPPFETPFKIGGDRREDRHRGGESYDGPAVKDKDRGEW